MHLLNKLGDELVKRKSILMNEPESLAAEDTLYIIQTRYYQNKIINDEIKNAIVNNALTLPEFEKVLLRYENFRKDEKQIKDEIAVLADKLEQEINIQELPVSREDMRIGNDLSTINIVKTVSLSKDFMQRYVGLDNDEEMYEKIANKCIIPFFILRIKKIISDVAGSESLKSNHIKITNSKAYTKTNAGINSPVLFDFIICIDIESLEEANGYNEAANYIRIALDYFNTYYEARTLE